MTDDEREYVSSVIISEGFEYAFLHYSHFEEVKNEEFHRLRKSFVISAAELLEFLEEQGVETEEQ